MYLFPRLWRAGSKSNQLKAGCVVLSNLDEFEKLTGNPKELIESLETQQKNEFRIKSISSCNLNVVPTQNV